MLGARVSRCRPSLALIVLLAQIWAKTDRCTACGICRAALQVTGSAGCHCINNVVVAFCDRKHCGSLWRHFRLLTNVCSICFSFNRPPGADEMLPLAKRTMDVSFFPSLTSFSVCTASITQIRITTQKTLGQVSPANSFHFVRIPSRATLKAVPLTLMSWRECFEIWSGLGSSLRFCKQPATCNVTAVR